MPRRRYIREPTTVTVDRSTLEELKSLRRWRGEPLDSVIRRLIAEYRRGRLLGY